MLFLDLRPGDGVRVSGGAATVTLEAKTGKAARLRIDAGPEVRISRIRAAEPQASRAPAPAAPNPLSGIQHVGMA